MESAETGAFGGAGTGCGAPPGFHQGGTSTNGINGINQINCINEIYSLFCIYYINRLYGFNSINN
jgi:hypothetical protein